MRPAGEVHQALLQAARELATPERAASLAELASKACVGLAAARRTVGNMTRRGQLEIVRERKVEHRNRPVAEYAPAGQSPPSTNEAAAAVCAVFGLWVQR